MTPTSPPSMLQVSRQQGFTMIELIVVIVILGILSAAALPRFVDLRSDAESASMQRLASNLTSASAMNMARCQITANVADGSKCITVSNCTDAASLVEGGVPASLPGEQGSALYIVSQVISATVNGTAATCTLKLDDSGGNNLQTLSFQGIAAGH